MPFSLPDKGEGVNDIQSILFQEYLDVLIAGVTGVDCVLSGGAVTAQGSPNMTVAVAKAGVLANSVLRAVAANASVAISAADGTHPRIDLVVITSAGAIAVRTGTPAAAPKPPARSANDVVLASVFVPASDTTIASNQITDLRVNRTVGPINIYRTTAAETTNNTTAAIHVLNKASSGVTIPDGLLLAGRMLRCIIAGNFLINSTTTPTLTLAISYGGSTLFADATIAGAQDADRGAWYLQFILCAQANNDQALHGFVSFDPTIAQRVAPTTGRAGNLSMSGTAANQQHTAPFAAAGAIDSDAGNRVLAVTWTFSGTAQAANEIVTESAILELL